MRHRVISRILTGTITAFGLAAGAIAQAQTLDLGDEAPGLVGDEDFSVFDAIFDEPVEEPPLVLCEDFEIVNPGFGFGEQDFNVGCPDQVILRNKGLSSDAYEVTAVRTDPPIPQTKAVLRALDKLTGRLTDLEVLAGGIAGFETLVIEVAACYKNPETETPENAAFLKVFDQISGEDEEVFSGWMYASSPSLSAMEHAIYDVWVVSCTS